MDDADVPTDSGSEENRSESPEDGQAGELDAPRRGRYRQTGRLGAGAMGEVSLCEDLRIGREVALKVVSGFVRDRAHRDRFLREARIQARLEHPSIVPVYEVGRDEDGDPYFTMMRVRGRTLREVMDGLRNGDPEVDPQHYTRRRLLSAFATVCLTVHYAHTRGVLHRDLKPSNIMLGEYGEIYVLDWGVAREDASTEEEERSACALPVLPDLTATGNLVGTPGYIAPEHARGEATDARADVYALGAILFEILTLERLHARDSQVALIGTISGIETRPSRRGSKRDIPPELDVICVRATALDAADRYPSARALHDAVDGFLEGDRDTARRREAAQEHATKARELADGVFGAGAGPEEDALLRPQAMSEVSRALALDPTNIDARRVLVHLLTEPPRTLPEPVKRDLMRHYEAQHQRAARDGAMLYATFFFWAPLTVLAAGDRRGAWYFGLMTALFAATSLTLLRASKLPYSAASGSYLTIGMTSVTLSSLSGLLGPLLLVPSLVMMNAIGFLLRPDRGRRRAVLVASLAAIAIPQLLEWTGLVPPSSLIERGHVIILPRILKFTPATHLTLFFATLGLIVAFALFFARFRESLTRAEERLSVHAWQLRQLLPDAQAR